MMEFKEVSLRQAENTILAHSLKLSKRKLKKGSLLNYDDIIELEKNDYSSVMVAIPSAEDIDENFAAKKIAYAIAGDKISTDKPFTGRCNLRAEENGLLILNETVINNINFIHESITIATIEPFTPVYKGQLIATIKIIPYAVENHFLSSCLALKSKIENIIRVALFNPKSIGFIQTSIGNTNKPLLDKTSKILSQRLSRLQSTVIKEIRCLHDAESVSDALKELQEVDVIVVSGATAVADRNDVVPSAVTNDGGQIIHYGMPVDPGNLLLLAKKNKQFILGMPGCARSPKFNGFDIIMERLVADISVSSRDIMQMGVGGLLKEIPERPLPRIESIEKNNIKKIHKINAIVLAAGQSSRMGCVNKLLIEIGAHPMIESVVKTLNDSGVNEVIVVTGFQEERIKHALQNYNVRFIKNVNYEKGLSTSLIKGIECLNKSADGFIVCLADMPLLKSDQIKKIISEFNPDDGHEVCVPTYNGKRGNPILWSRKFIYEMTMLQGDTGAKRLLFKHDECVHEVPQQDSAVLIDFDTQEAIDQFKNSSDCG